MRSLAAVAGLTIRAALRLRVFWTVAAMLLVVVLLLPPSLRDDGTITGRVRLLLAYTLGLSHGLLCLATLWLGADSLAREVSERQLQLVVVKPVARWTIWLGKWLGIVLLDLVLLAGAVGGAAWQARRAVADPRWDDDDRALVRQEILTARAELLPDTPDFAALAESTVSERLAAGVLTEEDNLLYARRAIRNDLEAEWQTVPPGGGKAWQFAGVTAPAGVEEVWFRFRARAAASLRGDVATVVWEAEGSGDEHLHVHGELRPDAFMAFRIPSRLVGADGRLTVRLRNDSRAALVFPLGDGPALRYEVGGFTANLLRAAGILLFQLAFLAALGLLLGSALSFPVAAFAALSYLICAAHVPFLGSRLAAGEALFDPSTTPLQLELAGRGFVRAVLWLAGSLHLHAPLGRLSSGLLVSWRDVAAVAWQLGLLQTGLAALAGMLVFARRELALGADR